MAKFMRKMQLQHQQEQAVLQEALLQVAGRLTAVEDLQRERDAERDAAAAQQQARVDALERRLTDQLAAQQRQLDEQGQRQSDQRRQLEAQRAQQQAEEAKREAARARRQEQAAKKLADGVLAKVRALVDAQIVGAREAVSAQLQALRAELERFAAQQAAAAAKAAAEEAALEAAAGRMTADSTLRALKLELAAGQVLVESRVGAAEAACAATLATAKADLEAAVGGRLSGLESACESHSNALACLANQQRQLASRGASGAGSAGEEELLPGWRAQLAQAHAAQQAVQGVVAQQTRFQAALEALTVAVCSGSGGGAGEQVDGNGWVVAAVDAACGDGGQEDEGKATVPPPRKTSTGGGKAPTKASTLPLRAANPRNSVKSSAAAQPGAGSTTAAAGTTASSRRSAPGALEPTGSGRTPIGASGGNGGKRATPSKSPAAAVGEAACGAQVLRRQLSPGEVRGLLDVLQKIGA
jgi:hypothetical protein